MSWDLRIWTPDRSTLKASYTPSSPGGIVDGFRWSVAGNGNSKQMRFYAVPRLVDIGPRDVVQLLINGQPAFYGYVETSWAPGDGKKREFVAVGAIELLRQRLMDLKTYAKQDVARIVRSIIYRLRHPAISYDIARVRDTGGVVNLGRSVLVPLYNVISDLAKTAGGVEWGVDSSGVFFFNEAGRTTIIDYENHGLNWLPIEGEEVVSNVALLMALTVQPKDARAWSGYYGAGMPYTETPLGDNYYIHYYRDPTYGDIYATEKAYVYSNALVPWAERGRSASGTVSNPGNAVDTDVNSYAEGPGDLVVNSPNGTMRWGQRAAFVYQSTMRGGLAQLVLSGSDLGNTNTKVVEIVLPYTGGERRLIELVMPSTPGGLENRSTYLSLSYVPDGARIYDARIYEFDSARLDKYAKNLVRLPFQSPAEVQWDDYRPPARYLTIVNAPGGTLTGATEVWEYELNSHRTRTVAKLGSFGADPAARAIRILADRRRDEAQTAAIELVRE